MACMGMKSVQIRHRQKAVRRGYVARVQVQTAAQDEVMMTCSRTIWQSLAQVELETVGGLALEFSGYVVDVFDRPNPTFPDITT